MFRIRVLGSLGKKLGRDTFIFTQNSVALEEAIKTVFGTKGESDYPDLMSSILVAVNGVAISGGIEGTILKSDDEVTLIPISHGG